MKFKLIIFTGFLQFLLFGGCQANYENQVASSEANLSAAAKNSDENFELTRKGLDKLSWFTSMYKAYEPETNAINEINNKKEDLSFKVFGASWCSDSRKALPKFYKVVESAQIHAANIELYGVDHEKNSQENGGKGKSESDEFNINRIPEFIVFYKGKEVGRLNEKPKKSLEEDLAALLK